VSPRHDFQGGAVVPVFSMPASEASGSISSLVFGLPVGRTERLILSCTPALCLHPLMTNRRDGRVTHGEKETPKSENQSHHVRSDQGLTGADEGRGRKSGSPDRHPYDRYRLVDIRQQAQVFRMI
jgi:hypothetical protein